MKTIQRLPTQDRPREKLAQKGAKSLSDLELVAILLGSGTKTHDVWKLSGKILKVLEIEGVGLAKATLIVAALEFARRRIRPEGFKITFPPDVMPLIQHLADRKQEHFLCISLNGANEVMAVRTVSVGLD